MGSISNINITTTAVGNILGTSSRNVGELCTHNAINMWSKRKPVRDSRITIPVDEVGMGDNCGLAIPAWTGDDTKLTTYRRPGTWVDQTGQHSTPFRLGDFRGYQDVYQNRPVTVGTKPSVLYKRSESIPYSAVVPTAPVVSLNDLAGDMRVGAVVYGKATTGGTPVFIGAATGGGGYIPLQLYGVEYAYLDIKFGLFEGDLAWTTTFPTNQLKYEIPRAYVGENPNWTNMPLQEYIEYIQNFEIAGFLSAQQIQYTIRAGNRTVGCTLTIRRDSDNTIIFQKSNINVTAGTAQSFTDSNVPLQAGVSYTVTLTSNLAGEPVITRPLFVG